MALQISTEDLAAEAGAMALELRIKNRLLAARDAKIAAQDAEIERLRALLPAEAEAT